MPKFINILFVIILILLIYSPSYAQVTCDVFDIQYKLDGKNLSVSLDTDLPDDTVLIISVSRSYWEKGSSEEYSLDYFSEKSTVKKWRKKRNISLDNPKWKADLENKQKDLARLDLGFDVDKISDKVSIDSIVPLRQNNPKFGERNSKLKGERVNITKPGKFTLRTVKEEIIIDYPLDGDKSVKSKYADPLSLQLGKSYSVSKETPLMPALSPSDAMDALENIKYIQDGTKIKIVSKEKKDNRLWYQVEVFENNQVIDEGWINSKALISQNLYIE